MRIFWKQETFLYIGKKERVDIGWIRVIGSEGRNKSKDCSFPLALRDWKRMSGCRASLWVL